MTKLKMQEVDLKKAGATAEERQEITEYLMAAVTEKKRNDAYKEAKMVGEHICNFPAVRLMRSRLKRRNTSKTRKRSPPSPKQSRKWSLNLTAFKLG